MAYNPNNPNGLATSANSAPVVIASDNVVDTAGNDNVATGNLTAADVASTSTAGQGSQALITGTATTNSTAVLTFPTVNALPESQSNIVIHISGTFVGTYVFERSPDNGTTWTRFSCFIAGLKTPVSTGTLIGMFHGNVAGTTNVRVRCTAFTSGSIAVRLTSGIGTGTVTVGNPIRLYDTVTDTEASISAAGAIKVDGSAVTQPVSLATNTPTLQSGSTTAVTQATAANLNAQVAGDTAAAATDAGNPVKAGYIYNSTPSTYTTGQRGNVHGDSRGGIYSVLKSPDGTTRAQVAVPADSTALTAGLYASSQNYVYTGSTQVLQRGDTTGTYTVSKPTTSGGLSIFSASVTAVQSVKASAGQVYAYHFFNPTAATAYVQIFNVASGSVTLGTTSPTISLGIPAGGGATFSSDTGIAFSTAISVACTTTRTGSTTAGCDLNIYYS